MNADELKARLLRSSRLSAWDKIRLERMTTRAAIDYMLTEAHADDEQWRAEQAEARQQPDAWEVEEDRADAADDDARRVRLYAEQL